MIQEHAIILGGIILSASNIHAYRILAPAGRHVYRNMDSPYSLAPEGRHVNSISIEKIERRSLNLDNISYRTNVSPLWGLAES